MKIITCKTSRKAGDLIQGEGIHESLLFLSWMKFELDESLLVSSLFPSLPSCAETLWFL
jgi:hypothetical protein